MHLFVFSTHIALQVQVVLVKSSTLSSQGLFILQVISSCFMPIQGLLNAFVYSQFSLFQNIYEGARNSFRKLSFVTVRSSMRELKLDTQCQDQVLGNHGNIVSLSNRGDAIIREVEPVPLDSTSTADAQSERV